MGVSVLDWALLRNPKDLNFLLLMSCKYFRKSVTIEPVSISNKDCSDSIFEFRNKIKDKVIDTL